MKYCKPIDGLRGIAVLLVILRHWHMPFLNLELGWIGVNIFFVLSGYLISTNLFLNKKKLNFKLFIKNFFIRRSLRIFPVYYFYLFVSFIILIILDNVFNISEFQNAISHLKYNYAYLLTYTYNFNHLLNSLAKVHVPGSKIFNHLWSLSIEEQFYLIFPFIIFFFKKRYLKHLMVLTILSMPFVRYFFAENLIGYGLKPAIVGLVIYKSTIFQIDSLATGVLISIIGKEKLKLSNSFFISLILSILVLLLGIVYLMKGVGVNIDYSSLTFQLLNIQVNYNSNTIFDYYYTISFTILNFLSAILIIACINNLKYINFLKNNFLVYLGKLSYGIYLYHNGFYVLFTVLFYKLIGKSFIYSNWWLEVLLFLLFFIIVIFISKLSFKYIEKPFLNLKSKFNS